MYCKFINKNSIRACPMNDYVGGRAISNLPRYFANNTEAAKTEGYKPLANAEPPTYDPATQYIVATYKETKKSIVQSWAVKDVEVIEEPTEETLESRVAALELKVRTAEAAGGLFSSKNAETAAPVINNINKEEETV